MKPELRWLQSFVAVAEEQHFSRAARRLNLAQPALTAHIQRLEAALGARLFERTNRMGGLTAAGRALLPEVESILRRTEALGRQVRDAARGECGLLRLGLIPPAATGAIADSLRRLNLERPDVELQIQQGYQDQLEQRLTNGDLDLVLGRPPESQGIAHHRLLVEEQGVLLRTDDPLASRKVVPLRQLHGRRLVLLRGNPHFGGNFRELSTRHGVDLIATPAAEDFPSLHWLVRAGLGVAPCSLLLAGDLPGGLTARPVRPAPPRLELHALWRGQAPPPLAARWLQMVGTPFA